MAEVKKLNLKTKEGRTRLSSSSSLNKLRATLEKRGLVLPVLAVLLLVIVAGVVLVKNKSMFVVAVVDGQPVLRQELNSRMTNLFGAQVLEGMIKERLIGKKALAEGIVLTDEQVETEIANIKATLPKGMTLEDSLALQGISQEEFTKQIKLQLMIQQLLAPQATVSAEEVDEFLASKPVLQATEAVAQRIEAERQLKQSKIRQLLPAWLDELKQSAKIEIFLE